MTCGGAHKKKSTDTTTANMLAVAAATTDANYNDIQRVVANSNCARVCVVDLQKCKVAENKQKQNQKA